MIQTVGNRVRGMRTLIRRFSRKSSGATAVEFALVGAPFFALLFAIIETAMAFWAGQLLETGVAEAGRQIRTGQVWERNIDAAGFKDIVCDEVGVLFACDDRLQIEVQRMVNFDEADLDLPERDADGNFSGTFGFDPGTGGQTVVVRGFYRWPAFFNVWAMIDAYTGNDTTPISEYLLIATTAFRNEPFN